MNDLIEQFAKTDAVGQLLAVRAQDSFHVVDIVADSTVTGLTAVADMSMRINGGYFVLRQGIFDFLNEGEDLVMDACVRAAKVGLMRAAQYDGFWAAMDTLKERSALEAQYRRGDSPWALWRERPVDLGRPVVPVPEIDPALP